jgi:hypothetical protein
MSAWELRRLMAKTHGIRLADELYEWFCAVKKTLSYHSAGTFLLLTLPEDKAREVLINAHERILGSGVPWHDFIVSNPTTP